jgi:signal transduction histidine kinase
MAEPLDEQALLEQIEAHLTPEARHWLAELLHDQVSHHITNASLQAEIVLRAWERKPEMALDEMRDLKGKLDNASGFMVNLIRTITPPAEESVPPVEE